MLSAAKRQDSMHTDETTTYISHRQEENAPYKRPNGIGTPMVAQE